MRGSLPSLGLVLSLSLAPAVARATVSEPNFTETELTSSPQLAEATGMAWVPDGSNRLFITIKDGPVRVIKDGVLLAQPFATLSPVYTGSECGVIGIAFDPDFLSNKYVYLFVTVSSSEQQIIRYTVTGDLGTDKVTVVSGLPTVGANHDGGGIGVGPDGKLYWAIGDNGSGVGVNADMKVLAAKVGRANRSGKIPSDNPFVDGPGGNNDYIWARGFRNPFTLTFQPATGLLWINVVGTLHEQIFIVHKGDHAGYNAYEDNQPSGFITPVIRYRTNDVDTTGVQPAAMSGAVRAGGVATFSMTADPRLRLGEKITIAGVADASFNGSFFVTGVPAAATFTVAQGGPDATSGGGTATTLNQGGCVTGGTFYDATQFPAQYRGNFFYGDYNSGRLMRATIAAGTNAITSVDYFGGGISGQVDMSVGPDGALYYVGHGGKVFRAVYNTTAQGLVVSPTTFWTADGQSVAANVRLAVAPAANVTVTLARSSGDADIGVSPATLTFTPANWNVPQVATITAAHDDDNVDDLAVISVTASALATEQITVHARDTVSLPEIDPDPDGGAPDVAPDTVAAIDKAPDQAPDFNPPDDGNPPAADAATPDLRPDAPAADAGVPDMAVALADAQAPDDTAQVITDGPGPALDGPLAVADARAPDARGDARTGGGDAPAADPDADATPPAASADSGCSCHVGGPARGGPGAGLGLVAFGALLFVRRRRKAR